MFSCSLKVLRIIWSRFGFPWSFVCFILFFNNTQQVKQLKTNEQTKNFSSLKLDNGIGTKNSSKQWEKKILIKKTPKKLKGTGRIS